MQRKNKLNVLAPLSVSMVVITLGAAFGVLSGRGALIGMISTCVITLITAVVGGSKYGVSSPTGPMTAAIGAILILDQRWLASHLNVNLELVELMNLTLFVSAVILLLLMIFRVHRLVKWVPSLVISGFVNGIALLIVIAQFRSMDSYPDWILMFSTFTFALIVNKLSERFEHMAYRIVSGSFFVIVFMSLVALILDLPVSTLDFSKQTASLSLGFPALGSIDVETMWIILPLAFELALIGLLDTLLTNVIMEKKGHRKSQVKRELSGQSLSLLAMSLFGGIPGAQSTVPSMMLYKEKGHHHASKLLIAVFCIVFTFLLSGFIQFVPLAVFGGIILKVALDVADPTSIKALIKSKRKQKGIRIAVTLGTALSTVFLSLNLAVIVFTCCFVFWNSLMPKKWHIPDLKPESESEGLVDEI